VDHLNSITLNVGQGDHILNTSNYNVEISDTKYPHELK